MIRRGRGETEGVATADARVSGDGDTTRTLGMTITRTAIKVPSHTNVAAQDATVPPVKASELAASKAKQGKERQGNPKTASHLPHVRELV